MTATPRVNLPLIERNLTFLIADLAGFTALTDIHGSRYAAWVITRYLALVQSALHPAARLAKRAGLPVLFPPMRQDVCDLVEGSKTSPAT